MWNKATQIIPVVIGAAGSIKKKSYMTNIPGCPQRCKHTNYTEVSFATVQGLSIRIRSYIVQKYCDFGMSTFLPIGVYKSHLETLTQETRGHK